MQAKYVQEWSIVRLPDGRIGIMSNSHYKRGKALVKITERFGVEISSTTEVEVLVTTAMGMREYMKILFSENAPNTASTRQVAGLSDADNLSKPAATCGLC
jgi:hypothetical protein